ncbi:MAG: VPLPA-CTERM sorting domain-containing protein [Congregibacter sp.]
MKLFTSKHFAALLAFVSILLVNGAQAAFITEEFDVEVLYGDIAIGDTGSIAVEYDTDLVDNTFADWRLLGDEFILSLDLFGQTFGNANDPFFDLLFPELVFDFGEIVFIDFRVSEFDFFNPTDILDPRIDEFGGGDIVDGTWEVTAFGTELASVPLPATLSLMMAGLLGGSVLRRRRLSGRTTG